MHIALIGPSGAGKGTLVQRLVKEQEFSHVSSGDLFRINLQRGTALGLLAKKYIAAGELTPDEIVDAMMEEWIQGARRSANVVFDGFPRTEFQAVFLDQALENIGRALDAVIFFHVPPAEIHRRLEGRWVCRDCQAPYHQDLNPPHLENFCDHCGGPLMRRPDDIPALIERRLRNFQRNIAPVLHRYAQKKKLLLLDAGQSPEEVAADFEKLMASLREDSAPFVSLGELAEFIPIEGAVPEPSAPISLDLVLLGGPGSGKGTQAAQLCKAFHLQHVSPGDLFRDNVKKQTDLGLLAKNYMERGELVPDDITEAMIADRLARPDVARGFILDGFPRNLAQAQALTDILQSLSRRLKLVLYVNVSDEEIVRRLSGRALCRSCQAPYHREFKPPKTPGVCDHCGGELYTRADDNPETIRARLKTFHNQTEPLIAFYQRHGILREVNGDGDIHEICGRLTQMIKEAESPHALAC